MVPEILAACPLFYEIYDKEIEKVIKYCKIYELKPEDTIVSDGDESREIYVVLDGCASIQKSTKDGVIKIGTLQGGDVFGEISFLGETKRQADVVAATDCMVLEISDDAIFKLYDKEPKVFGLLFVNISRLVTSRLAETTEKHFKLQSKCEDLEEKVEKLEALVQSKTAS